MRILVDNAIAVLLTLLLLSVVATSICNDDYLKVVYNLYKLSCLISEFECYFANSSNHILYYFPARREKILNPFHHSHPMV